jgi:hypothetical protein
MAASREFLMSFFAARYGVVLAVLCFCCGIGAAAAESVTVERDSVLRAEPRTEAAAVGNLANGATGEALARQGAWVQVRSGTVTGWLYSFNVRFGATAASGDGAGSVLGRVFGPRQRVSVTSTIGIRGLDEEDLKQARFDGGQIQQLDAFAASREQAESHAGGAGLNSARIDYLGETARAPAGNSGGNRE